MAVRTNIVENPSFENNYTDWWADFTTSGTVTRTHDTTESLFGSASFKIEGNTAADAGIDHFWSADNMLPAGTYYLSVWIKTENLTGDAVCVLRQNTDFAARIDLSTNTATQDWTRYSGSFTLEADRSMTLIVGLGAYGAPATGIAWFDGLLLERESDLVDYYDGSFTDTAFFDYAWTGTPHNSTSTRTDVVQPVLGNTRMMRGIGS